MTLVKGHNTPLGLGEQLCEILSRSELALKSHGLDMKFGCVHCDLDLWDMTLVQGHDIPLGYGQQSFEILSKSNMTVKSYSSDKEFGCVHCDLYLEDMTLVQDHDTPLGHVQQLCDISSRSEFAVESYDPDTIRTDEQTYTRILVMCDLDFGDITLVQGNETPSGHGQQFC